MDDEKIVELYLNRNEEAISHTQRKYSASLTRIAESILGDAGAAEECVNDTYLEAWRLIPPNEPRTYLFAFLGRITRHLAIDRIRHDSAAKRRAVVCELTQEMQDCIPSQGRVDYDLDAEEFTACLNAFLAECPEARRNIFIRRYWFFDPVTDIAKRYGFTESKVKTALFRTREDLRVFLQKRGYNI